MSRAISRESFDELKSYLGVYLQQGRVILDADWNENQDIAVASGRRLCSAALGDGSPNKGFAIESLVPGAGIGQFFGSALPFFMNFPATLLDDFESDDGWKLSSPQGSIRTSGDQPYEGRGFLRVSGHPGTVQLTRTLTQAVDLSASEFVTFRYRVNQPGRGAMKFFLEDQNGNRSVWSLQDPVVARDFWLTGFAGPLDLQFHILTGTLRPGQLNQSYSGRIIFVGGIAPLTASVTAGAIPTGLVLSTLGDPGQMNFGGTATTAGTFAFTVKLTDAAGKVATKSLTITIGPPVAGGEVVLSDDSVEVLGGSSFKTELPSGVAADVTRIRRYGFEIYQDAAHPLIWDFDSLRRGSNALYEQMAANNFAIRGSSLVEFRNLLILQHLFFAAFQNPAYNPVEFFSFTNSLAEPSIENAGRMYVAGLASAQIQDVLYSTQADPNDPPLTPPPSGVVRKDLVYLDVWQDSVTYVEDPEIREVALGGPDTSTRSQVRSRVRVAQGSGSQPGVLPVTGSGHGTLASAGSYTGAANRLYRVQIDTAGDIDTATFRWSDDNAATIQRIIQSVPPGSTRIIVEDASAFRPGDQVAISKEFGSEQHVIASLSGNAVTLASPTGVQLGSLPGNGRTADFTSFALRDRPRIQRWNAFNVPIAADPQDSTISAAIRLNDGVDVRFGGRAMAVGDYWNFRARFLSGDALSGLDPDTRLEHLRFERPRGVVHYYAPLGLITRNGSDPRPARIVKVQDRRQRIGNSNSVTGSLPNLVVTGQPLTYAGGVALPPAAADSKFLIHWSADLFMPTAGVVNTALRLQASLYNDAMTNPAADQASGLISSQTATISVARRPVNVDVPLTHLFTGKEEPSITSLAAPTPTSVQFFVSLSAVAGFTLQFSNVRVTVIEMKKGF